MGDLGILRKFRGKFGGTQALFAGTLFLICFYWEKFCTISGENLPWKEEINFLTLGELSIRDGDFSVSFHSPHRIKHLYPCLYDI